MSRPYSPQSDDSIVILRPGSDGDKDSLDDSGLTDSAPGAGGVVLQRHDYFTKPSLGELHALVAADGSLRVNEFVIGRRGYGEVCFPGVTDITGLNLDEIGMQ